MVEGIGCGLGEKFADLIDLGRCDGTVASEQTVIRRSIDGKEGHAASEAMEGDAGFSDEGSGQFTVEGACLALGTTITVVVAGNDMGRGGE